MHQHEHRFLCGFVLRVGRGELGLLHIDVDHQRQAQAAEVLVALAPSQVRHRHHQQPPPAPLHAQQPVLDRLGDLALPLLNLCALQRYKREQYKQIHCSNNASFCILIKDQNNNKKEKERKKRWHNEMSWRYALCADFNTFEGPRFHDFPELAGLVQTGLHDSNIRFGPIPWTQGSALPQFELLDNWSLDMLSFHLELVPP